MGNYWIYTCSKCGNRIQRSTAVLKCAVCDLPICGYCNYHGVCNMCAQTLPLDVKAKLHTKTLLAVARYFLILIIAAIGLYLMYNSINTYAPRDEGGIIQMEGVFVLGLIFAIGCVTILCYFCGHPYGIIEDLQNKAVRNWIKKNPQLIVEINPQK